MRNIFFIVLALFFVSCSQVHHKYAVVQEGDKNGVIDQTGYMIVKPIYEQIFNFDGMSGYIDHPHYVNLHWIHKDSSQVYAFVQNIDGKFGAINTDGKLLLKPIYDSITYFFNDFIRIEEGGKFGLVDRNFNVVLKPTYDHIQEFVGGIAILHHKNKYGCINIKMELKIKPTYDRIYFQQEDFLRTTLNEKWGYLDNKCDVLSKPIYDYGYDFSNGFAKVILDDKVGYLNPQGRLISKQIFTKESASF